MRKNQLPRIKFQRPNCDRELEIGSWNLEFGSWCFEGRVMRTILYLLRHGATEANLANPARLQGRRLDPPLAKLGVRQAEATRDFLAIRPIDQSYSSPLRRAM